LRKLDLKEAFRVKRDARELRVNSKLGLGVKLIGAERCDGYDYNKAEPLPPLPEGPAETTRKPKVFNPSVSQSENGTFKTLVGALEEAQPNDVVLIKCDGKVALNPLNLERAGLDVTLKPAPGCHPELRLKTSLKDAALFRIQDGSLRLEDLDIVLEPSEKDLDAQVVVNVAGEGRVSFKNCTITLGEPQDARLSVVSLGDPAALSRKPPRTGDIIPEGPTVQFEQCFIRGKGDLLWCRASRPFKFEATQTLAALTESVLLIEGSRYAETLPAPGPTDQGPRCQVSLKHCTVVSSAPIFHLRSNGTPGLQSLVPVKCQPTDCLFYPLNNKPLVLFSGLDKSAQEADLKDRLPWEGSRNTYGSFMSFLEQQVGKAMMIQRPLDRNGWKEFSVESESRFPEMMIKFSEPVDVSGLSRARPSQFKAADLPPDVGANVANLPDRSE